MHVYASGYGQPGIGSLLLALDVVQSGRHAHGMAESAPALKFLAFERLFAATYRCVCIEISCLHEKAVHSLVVIEATRLFATWSVIVFVLFSNEIQRFEWIVLV